MNDSHDLTVLRFTARARLSLALGVALACAARLNLNSWAEVVCTLAALARTLGWNIRARSVSVGPAHAARQVQSALDGAEQLARVRGDEPAMRERAAAVRAAITAVEDALERARAPARRSAA